MDAPEPCDVVIIGAGIAGIAAAGALLAAVPALRVRILEGGARVGGRIHTQVIDGGGGSGGGGGHRDVVEYGATWLHGVRGNELYRLARENDLVPRAAAAANAAVGGGAEADDDVDVDEDKDEDEDEDEDERAAEGLSLQ